ncbi:MAG: BTAD domain-containing putative transcriptional regulator [Actinomycetota bacterium]
MEFRVLGPVIASDKGRIVELSGPLERALLARLLVGAGTVISLDRLIEDLWDGEAPDTANVAVRVRVSRLRKALGNPSVVRTEHPGYVLVLGDEDALDSEQFESLLEQAHEALSNGDAATSAQLLREALDLWTGPALAGVGDAPFARSEAARLEEMRLTALEDRIEADLMLGRHSALVAELESLCGAHPLRERLWGQRMVALYRCGRQADALASFQQLRGILSEQLGIDPSLDLVKLESQILNQSSELTHQSRNTPPRLLTELPTGVVTFLLTDIEGSTELWESSDSMPIALERHDALVLSTITEHGGRLVKSKGEGDSTLSVFRRATDAVAAALELRSAMRAEPWPGDLTFSLRIALHTGEAHERDGDYYGPAVNRAARLRSIASGDQIVLSRVTAEVARDGLPPGSALLDLGEHALRGLSREERVFALVEEGEAVLLPTQPVIPPLPEALTMLETTGHFVGREEEIARINEIWKEVGTATMRTVMLAGEPGIGKTRLTSRLARTLFDDGAIVLYGRSDEDAVLPYQPFVETLRSYVAAVPKHQRGRLPHSNDLASLLPEIAPVTASKQISDDPEVARYRLFEGVAGLIAHISSQTPLVMVLDDLHWSDRPTLLMLRHVMRACASSKVLIVGTYRESELARTRPLGEMLADLRRERASERIALRGLQEDDVIVFLTRTAQHDVGRRGRALAHALVETTEGNPFFIEQILGHLVETGRLAPRDGVWTLDMRVEDLGIPEGVIEAIGRRMSRLSDSCNSVLTAASVVGRDFEIDVVTAMVDRDADEVLSGIEEALKAGLVRELQGRIRSSCTFSHALVQQAMYEELSLARKQRLHLKAANAIEALHGSTDDTVVVALARHLRSAGAAADLDKTTELSIRAMQSAWSVFAFEEAIAHGEATRDLLDEAGSDISLRARLLEQLGDLHFVAGTADESGLNRLEEAAALWERLGDGRRQARVYTKIGRGCSVTWRNLDIHRALDRLNAANALLQSTPDRGLEGRLAVALAGAAGYALDLETMEASIERGFELAQQIEDPRAAESVRIGSTATLGWLQCIKGECGQGMATLESAWGEANERDLVAVAMSSTWMLGGFGSWWDPAFSAKAVERELDKPRRAQTSDSRNTLLSTLAFCCAWSGSLPRALAISDEIREDQVEFDAGPDFSFFRGDWEDAAARSLRLLERHTNTGNAFAQCFKPTWTGRYLWFLGELDQAKEHLNVSLNRNQERCLPPAMVATSFISVIEADQNNLEAAELHLDRARKIMDRGHGWQGYTVWPLLAHACVASVKGEHAESDSLFERALSATEQFHMELDRTEALKLWGRWLAKRGDRGRAVERFDAAIELYRSMGVAQRFCDVVAAERARA